MALDKYTQYKVIQNPYILYGTFENNYSKLSKLISAIEVLLFKGILKKEQVTKEFIKILKESVTWKELFNLYSSTSINSICKKLYELRSLDVHFEENEDSIKENTFKLARAFGISIDSVSVIEERKEYFLTLTSYEQLLIMLDKLFKHILNSKRKNQETLPC